MSERRGFAVDPDSTVGHAVVGALVALTLSFLPFSTLAGGLVAAHRSQAGYGSGVALGVLAGAIAAVPLGVLFVPALGLASWLGFGVPSSSPIYGAFLAIVAALFLVYTVGLSALGGLVGAWTGRNTDWRLDPSDWL